MVSSFAHPPPANTRFTTQFNSFPTYLPSSNNQNRNKNETMDQNKKQKSSSLFLKSQFQMKRVVAKLIILVSVFSLFFSHTTSLSFLHYFNFYMSTLPFKLLSHTLDKHCTFLLCNGLLVFLAKYSGFFSLTSSSDKYNVTYHYHHESFKNYEDDSQLQMTITETTHHHQEPLLEQEAELENIQTQQIQIVMQQENENQKSEAVKTESENSPEQKHEEQEEEEERAVLEEDKAEAESETEAEAESSFFIEEVDDGDEEEGENGKLSNEELNKKFDDFIKKMKEELRIEAKQQLIMV